MLLATREELQQLLACNKPKSLGFVAPDFQLGCVDANLSASRSIISRNRLSETRISIMEED